MIEAVVSVESVIEDLNGDEIFTLIVDQNGRTVGECVLFEVHQIGSFPCSREILLPPQVGCESDFDLFENTPCGVFTEIITTLEKNPSIFEFLNQLLQFFVGHLQSFLSPKN